MQKSSTSATLAVFALFFGLSLLDAFASRNWWRAAFWLLIGLVFLGADRLGRRGRVER